MVWAHAHHFITRVVEDDHSVPAHSFLVEGEEVADLRFKGNFNGCSPLIDDGIVTVELGLDHPFASSIGDEGA
jgi:hypothetical protein